MGRQTKNKNSKKSTKSSKESSKMEIKGIIFVAIGLLTSIAIYTDLAGFLSSFAQRVCHLVIGIGSYMLPIYLLYLGYTYFKERGNITLGKRFYGVTLFIVVIIFISGTIYIQSVEDPDNFGGNLVTIFNLVAEGERALNGGLIGYIITFPLYKFIGAVGSYILYIALLIIASILAFDFSVVKAGEVAKNKSREYRLKDKSKKQEVKKEKLDDDYIKLLSKQNSTEEKSKDEFLKDVDHKIKILDFMKNSSIDDEEELEAEIASDNDIFMSNKREQPTLIEQQAPLNEKK
ncbi:DNA translocase FtsK 4TM domain-containing protein, partial [Clostridium sp. HBUAS56017]|uniref:DNA translocase FtsK 4TM domain-containing protein n=1 Tax=Clostridium sp. HBUAS56017 TaxID=2571128 RepID=UPI00325B0174